MISISRRHFVTTTGFGGAAMLASCKKSSPATTLTIGDQKGGLQTLLQVSGQLSNVDYKIEWAQFGAAAPLFEAMNAGAIDAGVAGDAPFVFFLASKPAVQAIAALNYTNPSSNAAAIMVRPKAGFNDIHDLVGKRVAAVRGSSGQYIVLATLQKAGLPLDAVNFTYLEPSDSMTTLLNGGVDGWGTWDPYTSIAELHYGLQPLPVPSGLFAGIGFIVATNQAITGKQAALQDFLTRFGRAREWAAAHSDEYAAAFSKDTGVPMDVARRYGADTAYAVAAIDGPRIATVQSLTDLYASAKLLPQTFPVNFAFNESFSL